MGVNSLPKTVTRQRRDCDFHLHVFDDISHLFDTHDGVV